MSGSTPRRRKHSPAVYRRRRIVVVLVALLIIAGLAWLFVAQPWRAMAATFAPSSDPTTASSPAPTVAKPSPLPSGTPKASTAPETPASEPTPQLTPVAEECLAADVLIEALTDSPSYPAGQNPQLSMRLTNSSAADCTLNVGTSAQSFTISSGSDVWWRSTDCQTEPSDMIVLLKAGQQVTTLAPLTWDRTRSQVGKCEGERPPAPGGGATYRLSVSLGELRSAGDASFQLN